MRDANQEIKSILELMARGKKYQNRVRKNAENLRKKIKSGETTTGDAIRDFVFSHCGFPIEEIESVYRGVNNNLAQHVGEFMLVIRRVEEECGCGTLFMSVYYQRISVFLCVIRSGSLVIDATKDICEFPTDNFISCFDIRSENPMLSLDSGNLTTCIGRNDLWFLLNKPLEIRDRFTAEMAELTNKPVLYLEIKFGDKEVSDWFDENKQTLLFQRMAKLFGRQLPETPEMIAELRKRRKSVIARLVPLVRERDEIRQKLDAIKSRLEDDERIIASMRPQERLDEVENQIKKELALAVELGMSEELLISPVSVGQLLEEYKS